MPPILRYLPNYLSLTRVVLAIAVVLLLNNGSTILATALFAVGALSDGVDGFLARRWHVSSALGAELDPLADKVLVLGTLATLQILLPLPLWAGILITLMILRETLITALRTRRFLLGKPLSTSNGAKWKTALQMVCAIVLLLGHSLGANLPTLSSLAQAVGTLLVVPAAALSLWSGLAYILSASSAHPQEGSRTTLS